MSGGASGGTAFVRGASYVLGEREADYTAIDNLNPLPELSLDNLTTSDGGGCSVNWCVDAKNIGCAAISGASVIMTPAIAVQKGDLLALGNPHDQLVAIGEVVNVLREGGPVEVRPKVVLAG